MTRGAQEAPAGIIKSIQNSKVLLVGAGGIGCEVIKNLVLMNFPYIEVVDLDTIDYSNLNRQFLFQKKHVKQSKALVAAKAAQEFNANVKIVPHHANIMDEKFDLNWFKTFNIVFNALDNLEARRYVNRMCLLSDTPLIESGTAGYFGQSTVIKKNVTECFECVPKETPKTFPVCTIRLTPSLPIHCIVWAKSYLFNQLFGEEEENLDNEINDDNRTEIEELKKETQALNEIKNAMATDDFIKLMFNKVFTDDIIKTLQFEEIWKNKTKPTPLKYETIDEKASSVEITSNGTLFENKKLELEESFKLFKESARALATRIQSMKESNSSASMSFDKDDDEMLKFVTGASNLRAHIFNIQTKSIFEVKAMAGNIIPAIATTNAIIAGVMITSSFKILRSQIEQCKTTFLVYGSNRPRLLYTECLAPPKLDCAICSSDVFCVSFDLSKNTINDIITESLNGVQKALERSNVEIFLEIDWDEVKENLSVVEGSR
ncbi:hypothetical protein K502DRAFT_286916 [Neoconidiobolus thromboides FSU 785]|nr:hypothetical protein K502DRAFT_286916 [Neoconidiobolus thromboides FSU 785]